jgi:hypothetical protein
MQPLKCIAPAADLGVVMVKVIDIRIQICERLANVEHHSLAAVEIRRAVVADNVEYKLDPKLM